MKPKSWFRVAIVVAAAMGAVACAPMTPPPSAAPAAPPAPPSLYQRLGGQPAIVAAVDDFVANVAADRRINRFFRRANVPHLKEALVAQLCQATGGPCVYTGPPMQVVHHGMHIQNRHFDALVQDLVKTLNKLNVPQPLQQELLGTLGPLRKDIVNV